MIPYGRQRISKADIELVTEALSSDLLTNGPRVAQFERKLSEYVGAPTIVVSSGTAALHCAFSALDLQPGDEIITPPITFIATQATAALAGATVKFCDVQADTGNLDPEKVESKITRHTRAIVAVDYAGHPAELNELSEIARRKGVLLIEDASHAIGSTYRGFKVGEIADITTFSFFPTKNLTTAEGGAVSSRHPELLKRIQKFSKQGLVREQDELINGTEGPWHQEVHEFGLNYRLSDILSALGISQLSQIENFKKTRSQIFDRYFQHLGHINRLTLPTRRSYTEPMWHLFPIHVPADLRRSIFEELRRNDIGVQVNYLPVHLHPVFARAGYKRGDFPISEDFYDSEISLPMHANPEVFNEKYFTTIAGIFSSILE